MKISNLLDKMKNVTKKFLIILEKNQQTREF